MRFAFVGVEGVFQVELAVAFDEDSFAPFPPDLAVEVISKSETEAYSENKVRDHFGGGVAEVWQVFLDSRVVRVITGGSSRIGYTCIVPRRPAQVKPQTECVTRPRRPADQCALGEHVAGSRRI